MRGDQTPVQPTEIIWTGDDIAHLKRTCSADIAHAVDLAANTGLRRGDLLRLQWSNLEKNAIVVTTAKSHHKREAAIPLHKALREVLACIPRRDAVIPTSSKGNPWADDGLSCSFQHAKGAAWPEDKDLNFHDLRGTAATKLYLLGYRNGRSRKSWVGRRMRCRRSSGAT